MSTFPDLDSLQEAIHMTAELDTDVPEVGDQDYTVRTQLIGKWVRMWENEEGMTWNELWDQASVTNTGANSYDLSSGVPTMKKPGGWVRYVPTDGGSIYFPVIPLQNVANMDDLSSRFCYFTGNPFSGFTINFNPNGKPTGSDGTIQFPYYKKATIPTAASDKVQMSDPYYVVHGVVADIYSTEDPGESDKNFQIAQQKLIAMKLQNTLPPWYQENTIPDQDNTLSVSGFGI